MDGAGAMIRVEHLSKRYRVPGLTPRYRTLSDIFASTVAALTGSAAPKPATDSGFYALNDVSFSVAPGEVVAVIGRNGAGKSTLLKILSRITWPTAGRVVLYGQAGSLLEIGAGFHGELTGRENVFLSASVLGMSRAETRRRFDEIVAFSGIEAFIDMPVKYYSSGMYLRLAFSIASSVQPDILFIDEALGVGDADFQRRCHERIREIGRSGRTVVFVTHNLQTLPQLTSRALWLDKGTLRFDGDAHRAVSQYLADSGGAGPRRDWDDAAAPGDEAVRLRGVRITGEDDRTLDACDVAQPFGVELVFDVLVDGHVIVPRLEFCNAEGACLFWSFEVDSPWHRIPRPPGRYRTTGWLPAHLFSGGPISVGVAIQSFTPWSKHVDEPGAVSVLIVESPADACSRTARGDYTGHIPGFVRPLLRWTTTPP
ncbi:MAG: ABC transporter ATP-binding protein [Vicinamibacterales bacterium]